MVHLDIDGTESLTKSQSLFLSKNPKIAHQLRIICASAPNFVCILTKKFEVFSLKTCVSNLHFGIRREIFRQEPAVTLPLATRRGILYIKCKNLSTIWKTVLFLPTAAVRT